MPAFEGSFLGVPSSFTPTNFHGIEFSTGIRLSKFDYWLSMGTAVTVLNLGHGGPGTLRLGGSFGAGFNFAHGFGYVRGRAEHSGEAFREAGQWLGRLAEAETA